MLRDRHIGLLMAVLAFALSQGLHGLGWLDAGENTLLSSCFRLRGELPPAAEVAVVGLASEFQDYASARERPRGLRASAEFVDRMREAEAAVVVLDAIAPAIGLAGGASVEDLARLAEAMREANNVVLPSVVQASSSDRPQRERPALQRFSCGEGKLLMPYSLRDGHLAAPPDVLCEAAAGLGHLNIYPDRDGVIRSVPLLAGSDGVLWPSLALEVARVYLDLPPGSPRLTPSGVALGERTFATNPHAEMLVNFSGGFGHFPHTRMGEVLESDTSALRKLFAGKIVIVGPTSSDLTTLWRTPIHPVMPGVSINANAVANLLHHNELKRPDRWVPVALAFLAALLIGWVAPSVGAIRGALLSLGVVLAVFVVLAFFFLNGVWIPMSAPLLAPALAGLVLVARAASDADRERAQADVRLESRVQAIAGIGGLIVSARDRRQLLEQVVHWVERELDVPAVSILLVDERERKLRFEIASGEKGDEVKAFTLDIGQGVAGTVALTGQPLIVQQARTDPRQAHDIADAVDFPTDSILCVPMELHGTVVGVIEALNKRSGPFTSYDQALLTVIAQQATLFLESARLYSELQERVDEATADLREANRDLGAQKAKIETLVNEIEAGVIATDSRDRIVTWNRAAERLLDLAEAKAIGEPALSVIGNPALSALFAMPLSPIGGRHDEEIELDVAQQDVVVRASITLMDEGDGGVGKLALLTDITRLKDLDRMKTDLISFVSHELKNPLASIKGFAEVLERGMRDDARDMRLVRFVGHQATKMQRLVEDFLDVTRIEVGMALEMRLTQIADLRELIQEVVDLEAMTAPSHEFIIEVDDELPPFPADRGKIEQVLVNLVNNAVKYSPEGGEVRIGVAHKDEEVLFAVSDQGIGIQAEDLPNLFQRFRRVAGARQRVQGTGIGLFLSKHLVEAHGGRIWVESGDQGTTFRFTIPIRAAQEATAHLDAPTGPSEAR